ncbi:hypothetical protein GVAV_001175 [Gurleya vavrai]
MHLTGAAFKFFDELNETPHTWKEFKTIFENRYGPTKIDKPSLMLKVLSRKQMKNEKTKEFINEIIKQGETAGISEELLVQTIIGNLKNDKKIFYKCLMKKFTFNELFKLSEQIENENTDENELENENFNFTKNNDEIQILSEKIENMTFTLNKLQNNQNVQQERILLYCESCQKNGHSKFNCYKKNNSNNQANYEKPNLQNQKQFSKDFQSREEMIEKRINYLEKNIQKPIEGSLKDLKLLIPNPTPEFLKIFEAFPEYYKAKETLRRNEKFLEETIKSIKNIKPKINTAITNSENITYDIIKSKVMIENNEIDAVLDTGANFSIISESLANKLNLPISIN